MLVNGVLAVGLGHHGECFVQTQPQGLHIRCQRFGTFRSLYAQILKFLQVFDDGGRFFLGTDGGVQIRASLLKVVQFIFEFANFFGYHRTDDRIGVVT